QLEPGTPGAAAGAGHTPVQQRRAPTVRVSFVLLAAAFVHPAQRDLRGAGVPEDEEHLPFSGARQHATSTAMRTELVIFTLLFALVAGLGFYAVRWNSRGPLDRLDEWALGGRRFGFWVSFFLNSGEIFTASTFIALPALMFGVGAVGFYLLPFTIFAYSLAFLPLVRLWSVSRANGYVTPADYVTGRYGSTTLGL